MRIDNLHDRTNAAWEASKKLSAQSAELLEWAHKFLKANGWQRTEDRRRSAMFEKVYQRGQREIVLCGWHGTGAPGTSRNYGNLKLIWSVGDNHPGEKGPRELYAKEQIKLDIIDGTVKDAEDFLLMVKGYIQALK